MSSISSLSAAVIGTGFIGGVHLQSLRRIGVRISGILGSSPARAGAKAAEWGIDHVYSDLNELLDDPAVDVVHITSPNDEHFAQARAALLAGKHVVCEKPLAMDSRQTRELSHLAAASRRVAAVNYNIRFYPQVREMRARIADGRVGQPHLITGSYLQDWLLYESDWNWRVDSARGGPLRAVGDIGSHWFDVVAFVSGAAIESVFADLSTFVPSRRRPVGPIETFSNSGHTVTEAHEVDTEDAANVLLHFAGGARGAVTVSQVSAGRKNRIALEISAAAASLSWNGERPDELWIGHRDRPNELLMRDPALLSEDASAVVAVPGGHAEGFENTFAAMYREVYTDVLHGGPSARPNYATFADGHQENLILDAIAESARTGQWTSVVAADTEGE
ncbi:MAG TPA: Gfo/Idh/MocA family oxidoreductase [Pseudolysinimonas sp.]|nr:Gfo/Idh/MocA family oxidoreductase [Pseudolysinimonas sp.]